MKFLVFFIFIFTLAFAENNQTSQEQSSIIELNNKIEAIDTKLKNNTWIIRYANYNTYQNLVLELKKVENEIKKGTKSSYDYKNAATTLKEQIDLLKEYEKSPFQSILTQPDIEESKKITNPIALFGGFSYIKQLNGKKEEYNNLLKNLDEVIEILKTKEKLSLEIYELDSSDENYTRLEGIKKEVTEFQNARVVAGTTFGVYQKKIDESINHTSAEIKNQIKDTVSIAVFVLVIFLVGILIKFICKKYISDNERLYTINKIINFNIFIIIIFILLFAYIENVSYVVTILGFASAGLAIAMKDMFMSMLGWGVIVISGTFHVGDRIKVRKNGGEYVGDIIDISLIRMTIYEDITLTTYQQNRRSGRVIFIPNNYIFTDLILNYTHSGMKTVWDGIDVLITFDSNHKKASYIIKNIVRQYAKGYTDIAKKQMNKLRDQYNIKNPNVEPRIFTLFEPYGINISVWYMTDSYAALKLRSTISLEIIEAFNKEDDIKIAFPKQTLYFGGQRTIPNLEALSKEILY